jgi:putative flippase GtrA
MKKNMKELILYGVFGVLTTVVNIGIYQFFYSILGNLPSNILAWVISVLFAFFTNDAFVFSGTRKNSFFKRMSAFFAARLASGALDMILMFVFVDVLHGNALFWKLTVNVLVIIINYVLSKFYVFSSPKTKEQ